MSLPNAPKDISDSPAKGSVVAPVDKQAQAADVDRKLKFYGAVNAIKASRMPTNDQIDSMLRYLLDHSLVASGDLSSEGKKMVGDTRDVVETLRLIVKDKNADELFQNFVWHTRDVDFEKAKKDPNEVIPVGNEKAKNDGQQAVQHLRTLLTLIFTNAEVRKLLSDFSIIGRDLLARGAMKAAEMTRPDEERLRTVDDSAPNDTFHTEGGRRAGPDETPVRGIRCLILLAPYIHISRRFSRLKFLEPTRQSSNILARSLARVPPSTSRMAPFVAVTKSPLTLKRRKMNSGSAAWYVSLCCILFVFSCALSSGGSSSPEGRYAQCRRR